MSELTIPVRYDGRDAESHQIELHLLGESMKGIARVLAVTGHFAVTGQYAKQMQALDVRVLSSESRANCFTFDAIMQFSKEQQLFGGLAAAVVAPIIAWIIARASNDHTQMKLIKDSLDKTVAQMSHQNAELTTKLLATIDKMADALRPSLRDAVAPVGKTCSMMTIGTNDHEAVVIDEATADAIRSIQADEVTEQKSWTVLITELDLENRTGKVRLENGEAEEEKRIKARFTDPQIDVISNPYVVSFAAKKPLAVVGKAVLKDGEIHTLYISDVTKPV